jgi:hypothetical protein
MKRTKRLPVSIAVACLLTAALPALGHHSTSMFDDEKVVELKGTVKELQWTNPHIWLQVVAETNGTPTEWSLEGGSPNSLSRQGWRSTTFKPGDEIAVRFNPMRDGAPGGRFIGARFDADGRTIGRWE